MNIDKIKVKQAFTDYVKNYDSSDEKIQLKIDHTYRVSEICESLAKRIGLSKQDIDIAYVIGILHDIGRFEQVKRYGTFNDAKSINHAALGVDILFNEGKIRDFLEDDSEDELIKNAIDCHNAYKIPDEFSIRTKTFSNILRDADKIDIFKVNTIVPLQEIYNVINSEDIYTSSITKEVMDDINNKETVLRKNKKTAVDNVASHISLVFGLVYDESIDITVKQGCLQKLMSFKSKNEVTNTQLNQICKIVNCYIKERSFK